jgi:hypothetical protein
MKITHLLSISLVSLAVVAADAPTGKEPVVITPGKNGAPPSDAIVLLDGKDMSHWKTEAGGEAKWKLANGYMEVVKGTGNIFSKEDFGDVQVHVEFAEPTPAIGTGQDRGNSGVYLQGRYEVQVLDCYNNKTYPDGQTGAIYGIAPPLVNACRPPGEWQTYDIVFHPPKQTADGKMQSGSFTVLQNGVLIQDHTEIKGEPTRAASLSGVAEKGPLVLQDHGHPVRYRNIWVRRL